MNPMAVRRCHNASPGAVRLGWNLRRHHDRTPQGRTMTSAQLDQPIRDALARGGVIDITTIGRKTGQPHRIEIVFHNVGGRLYVSGMPGFKRSYMANLAADPHFTFHLKGAVRADLP